MFKHQMRVDVRWGDMDAYGHVNNTVFFRYFEMARFCYFEELGLDDEGMMPTVVIAKIQCQFKKALVYPASITVTSRVTKLGGSSFEIEAEIYQGEVLCAHSVATMVWVDGKTHKPKKLTAEVKSKIARYEGLVI